MATLAVLLASCAGGAPTAAAPEPEGSGDATNALCPTPETAGTIKLVNPANLGVFASVYMAYYNDMFKDAGIDVQMEKLPSVDALPLLAQGQVDLLMTSYSAAQFNGVEQGVEFQWVMPFDFGQETDPNAPVPGFWGRVDVVGDADDMDLSALKGQTVSSPTAGTGVAGMILDNALAEDGIGFEDVVMTRLSGPDALLGLQNGAVSAAWIAAPLEAEAAKDPSLVPIAGYAPGVTGTAIIAGPTGMKDEQLLVGFIQVVNAAIQEYLTGDWREDDEVVAQLSGILETSEDIIRNSPLLVFDPMTMDGVGEFLTDLQTFQIDQGQLDYTEPQDVNDLFSPQYVEAALTCSTDWMNK
ncbi:hypothetical protein ASD65_13080 [Microbacterium sp. Root61]|uniref:ABC transporter substrate-binding protein n=1 Tax=Microbacterium sp. Root61 TaxID=1736570 RepID=UPI0006FF8CC5|nr:ABC transporter substrate-binding protein [Microbacterium sp. Root61]KRA25251.1 hypothetical protein ASD65_13080 [Microbacterium sp. Root61]